MKLFYLLIPFLFISCASYKRDGNNDAVIDFPNTDDTQKVYLVGEMGGDIRYSEKLASGLLQEFKYAKSNDILLFLGNNIDSKKLTSSKEKCVQSELDKLEIHKKLTNQFPGKTYFIPGNSEWKGNQKGLLEVSKTIQEKIEKARFLPENSCPLSWIDINDDFGILFIDSEWYITNWNRNPHMNAQCTENYTRAMFLNNFEEIIKSNPNKTIIIASHHPVMSMGKSAGYYPANVLFPLDFIRVASGLSQKDMQFPRYQEFTKEITTRLNYYKNNFIIVSAHECNLQSINKGKVKQVISGGGNKPTAVHHNKTDFQYTDQGFAELILNPEHPSVSFYNVNAGILDNVHLFPSKPDLFINEESPIPSEGTTSIYSKETIEKIPNANKRTGKRYREYYKKEFSLPSLILSEEKGGLEVVGEYDGYEKVELVLKDQDGREYLLRRAENNASMYLQKQFYPSLYVEEELKETAVERFTYDFYTTQYPFVNFIVPTLSKEANLYYTKPKAFFVPSQKALGNYNSIFENRICWLEEKAGNSWKDHPIFDNVKEILSNVQMEEKWVSNASYKLDEAQLIRNRLFDLWINDWDRSSRNFKWGLWEDGDKIDIKLISVNHEEAFSKYDGKSLKFLTKNVFPLKKMQSFERNIPHLDNFNQDIFKYDITYLQTSSLDVWLQEAKKLQKYLSDKEIEEAVNQLPSVLKDETSDFIIANLKKRRQKLEEWAKQYHNILKDRAVLSGTMQSDSIQIIRNKDKSVDIRIASPDKNGNYILYKKYHYTKGVTSEIWVYALGGSDYIEVLGKNSLIKIYLVGGGQKDQYNVHHKHRVHIFEHSHQRNEFLTKSIKKNLSKKYSANTFDKEKFRYNRAFTQPIIHIGVDRGTRLGLQRTWLKNKYTDYKYNILQKVGVEYFTLNNGLAFEYESRYRDFFKILTFGLDAIATTPSFTRNFFGYGMNTAYDQDRYSFYRYRQSKIRVTPSLIREFPIFGSISLSFPIEEVQLTKNENSFLASYFDSNTTQIDRNVYYGPALNFSFENADDLNLPNIGLQFGLSAGYKIDAQNEDFNFHYIKSFLSFQFPIIKDKLVFASRLSFNYQKAKTVVSVYFATTIGGVAGLRGFRNERFTADSGFWQVSDLRLKLFEFRPILLPGTFGISAGVDYGKVWMSNKDFPDYVSNSDQLNEYKISYGGGIYFNIKTLATLRAVMFHSEEQNRFDVMLGFNF